MSKLFKIGVVAVLTASLLALFAALAVAAPNVENTDDQAPPCPTPLACVDGVDANGDQCGFCYCPATQDPIKLWDQLCSVDPVDPPAAPPSNPPPSDPPLTDQPQPEIERSRLPNTGNELVVNTDTGSAVYIGIALIALALALMALAGHKIAARKGK